MFEDFLRVELKDAEPTIRGAPVSSTTATMVRTSLKSMLLVHPSILSRVYGGIRFEMLVSDKVENIAQSISVSLDFFGRNRRSLPFFAVNAVSHSTGYDITLPQALTKKFLISAVYL